MIIRPAEHPDSAPRMPDAATIRHLWRDHSEGVLRGWRTPPPILQTLAEDVT